MVPTAEEGRRSGERLREASEEIRRRLRDDIVGLD